MMEPPDLPGWGDYERVYRQDGFRWVYSDFDRQQERKRP